MFDELRLRARQFPLGPRGWLRSAIGGGIGIAVAGLFTGLALTVPAPGLPWLVAPLGASAVLVFAVPASPLAQPWPVLGGNMISAAIGLALGALLPVPVVAAALAVGLAIAVMSILRCLHPPGGACALLCAMGAAGPDGWGAAYLLLFALNVALLCVAGWLYNGATGHPWPHKVVAPPQPEVSGYDREDLDHVLDNWDEILDVDRDDLDAVIKAVERQTLRRTGSA